MNHTEHPCSDVTLLHGQDVSDDVLAFFTPWEPTFVDRGGPRLILFADQAPEPIEQYRERYDQIIVVRDTATADQVVADLVAGASYSLSQSALLAWPGDWRRRPPLLQGLEPLHLGERSITGLLASGSRAYLYTSGDEVIKVPRLDPDADPWRTVARFAAEVRSLHVCQGEGVVSASELAFDVQQHLLYVRMPHAGVSIASTQWSLEKAAHIVQRIAQALARIHAIGYRHGDVTPANVLRTTAGGVALIDFGVSSQGPVHSVALKGTPAYLAPECFRGDYGLASDVFSLGVLAYELWLGQPPFPADRVVEQAAATQQITPRHPLAIRPDFPAPLQAALRGMLRKNPESRWPAGKVVSHLCQVDLAPRAQRAWGRQIALRLGWF